MAIPLGCLSALKRYTVIDYTLTAFAFIGISIPGFFFALIIVQVFAQRLGWLPSVGMHSSAQDLTGFKSAVDVLKHLVLPTIVLSLGEMAYWMRFQRSSLLEVLGQDYIRTARAKGLTERMVLLGHALRNALIPVVTIAGLSLPMLVSGAYITETVFAWPGMGRLGVGAVLARDYPVVMGVTMLSSLLVVVGNLMADVAYAFVDPRIRHQ
jgi:peptide/nickel transport system permease protein